MELKMNLTQNISLSQKMIQSMEILQMSALELDTYIQNMALENPVIDIEESTQTGDKRVEDIKKKLDWLNETDEQNQVYYRQESEEKEEMKEDWYMTQPEGEMLEEYLMSQLLTMDLSRRQKAIAEYIILSLDSKGYLVDGLDHVCAHFCISVEQAEKILCLVQSLEPAGVGARNIAECLCIQAERIQVDNPYVTVLIQNYLEMLGKNKIPAIAKEMGIDVKEVSAAYQIIKELNPKPGNAFCTREQLKYIVPDVVVVKLSGYYEILINEYQFSKININSYYRTMSKQNNDEEVKQYLNQKIKQAEWISNCISQRNFTLSRVARTIVEIQDEFFAKGPGHKVPMKLSDIALKLQIHESTVSRAVRDKYLQCMFGVYPLNYFFSGSIAVNGEQASLTPEQIKEMIKVIVEQEDKTKPYSDRIICEILQEKQVVISRRTVAKYRESMEIPDRSGRKQY